ncbi:lanthionine synthetase C family protein [Pedobacter sp. WC2423]|uniref:lanthionine synthetase C family protein n=1 Tax=Pedobacter sp. WC2423 TaxID=3234142 RepID=UPI0034657852
MKNNHKVIYKIEQQLMQQVKDMDHSFINGRSGAIVALSYYNAFHSSADQEKHIAEKIKFLIQNNLDDIESKPMQYSLFFGLAGICYSIRTAGHLDYRNAIPESWLKSLDRLIVNSADHYLNINEFDLMRGAGGILTYLLHFNPSQKNTKHMIRHLLDAAICVDGDKFYWGTYDMNVQSNQLEYSPEIYNLGLAHGIPGIISILSECYRLNFYRKECAEKIHGAINFIISRQVTGHDYCFPARVKTNKNGIGEPEPSRLGWCYGDLGVAIAILKAGQYCGNKAWIEKGKEIACMTLGRTGHMALLDEHGLCHGYLGTMHMYNRVFKATGDPVFQKQMRYWESISSKDLDFKVSETGFFKVQNDQGSGKIKLGSADILQGLSGILLCLLSSRDGIAYPWDRAFLTNIEN